MKREDKTMDLKGRNFLTLKDFTAEEIEYLIDLAAELKEKKKQGVTDHPDMIPYSELSEEVKEYDRVTARTTIEAFNYMTHSFIYINTTGLQTENPYAPKNKVPWTASQADMLAEDWVFAE